MKVALLVNHVFDGWTPYDTRLGGTEEGVVEWARMLSKWGHHVTVFQNGYDGSDGEINYLSREVYPDMGKFFDVTLNHKSLDMPIIGRTYYLTTETDASDKDLSKFDGVIWPSQWAKDNIPVNNNNVHVINYGYNPAKIKPSWKIPNQCLYASSPDRGLDTLLDLWPEVVARHPKANLIVTYGAQPRSVPNTTFLGAVSEEDMNDLYATSDLWLHPCNGGELFGITAVKAQAAGAIPVYFPTMALSETVKNGFPVKDRDEMVKTINELLGNETKKDLCRSLMKNEDYPTWESTAEDILSLIEASKPNVRVEGV